MGLFYNSVSVITVNLWTSFKVEITGTKPADLQKCSGKKKKSSMHLISHEKSVIKASLNLIELLNKKFFSP